MTWAGPESPEVEIVAIRLSRPGAAGHPTLADPAEVRRERTFAA